MRNSANDNVIMFVGPVGRYGQSIELFSLRLVGVRISNVNVKTFQTQTFNNINYF